MSVFALILAIITIIIGVRNYMSYHELKTHGEDREAVHFMYSALVCGLLSVGLFSMFIIL